MVRLVAQWRLVITKKKVPVVPIAIVKSIEPIARTKT